MTETSVEFRDADGKTVVKTDLETMERAAKMLSVKTAPGKGVHYKKPDKEHLDVLKRAQTKFHKRLAQYGITVSLLVARAEIDDETGETKGPALKHRGLPALGVTRAIPVKLRAHGLADAEITIDGDEWKGLTNAERLAIMDHELTHIEPKFDSDGNLKLDTCGRPKIEMRHHDYEFGWFTEVAGRHREASQEVQQARKIIDRDGQLYFDFAGLKG